MKKIKCIKCEPHKEAVLTELNDDLKSLQKAVDGYIELVYPFEMEVAILCNEEGKLIPLEFSRPILDDDNNILDLIAGTCYIVGVTPDGYRDLTYNEIKYFLKYYQYPIEVFKWTFTDENGEKRDIIDIIPKNEKGRKVKAYGR